MPTLFIVVAINDTDELNRLLLEEKDCSANEVDEFNNSVLHVAVLYGAFEAAQILIANGAHVNHKGNDDNTPLHTASANQWPRLAKLLIENNADKHALNRYRSRPADYVRHLPAFYQAVETNTGWELAILQVEQSRRTMLAALVRHNIFATHDIPQHLQLHATSATEEEEKITPNTPQTNLIGNSVIDSTPTIDHSFFENFKFECVIS